MGGWACLGWARVGWGGVGIVRTAVSIATGVFKPHGRCVYPTAVPDRVRLEVLAFFPWAGGRGRRGRRTIERRKMTR